MSFTEFLNAKVRKCILPDRTVSESDEERASTIIFAQKDVAAPSDDYNSSPHSGNLPRAKRARGTFHLKYGYVADDEAAPDDVSNGLFTEADLKEWNSIIDNKVFGPVISRDNLPPDSKPCRTRFRRTWKLGVRADERKAKSRFLVCETNDPRDVEITTEMPSAWIRRMAVVGGLSKGWSSATIDVKTAFLLVPLPKEHGEIFVKLPNSLPDEIQELGFKPNEIRKLNKSLYGLKEAPRLFNEFLVKTLAPLGWTPIVSGVFEKVKMIQRTDGSHTKKRIGYLIAYVDDLLCLSKDPLRDLEEVSGLLKCSDLLKVDGTAQRHVGMQITATEKSFFFDINGYIKDIPDFESEIDALGHE